ncbi:MAG: 16S rRNA (guanine(527)-N(7))-methyltransferase RsmG [Planctomycetota bacterium]
MPPLVNPDDATPEVPNTGASGPTERPDDVEPAAEAQPEEPEEVIAFEGHTLPAFDEVRSALEWAFTMEEGLPPSFLDRCAEHALLVLDGNTRLNLTKIVEPREVAAKHYLDAWRAMRVVSLLGRSVLDIGTGGGYPGVPIALAERDTKVVLLDSVGKKARFVQETIEAMGITNAVCLPERAEDHLARNRYEVVFMRAVSSVRENVRTLRKVRHSLVDLVMLKGPSWSREIRGAEREAERLGFRLDTVWEHELPGEMGQRAVLVYRAPGGAGL